MPGAAVRRVPLAGLRLDAVPFGGGTLRRWDPDALRQVQLQCYHSKRRLKNVLERQVRGRGRRRRCGRRRLRFERETARGAVVQDCVSRRVRGQRLEPVVGLSRCKRHISLNPAPIRFIIANCDYMETVPRGAAERTIDHSESGVQQDVPRAGTGSYVIRVGPYLGRVEFVSSAGDVFS